MSKGIIIAKDIRNAEVLGDNISLEEEVSNSLRSLIESDKKKYKKTWKIVNYFYGSKGDFLIKSKDIPTLKREILELINHSEKNKINKKVTNFLNNLLDTCKKAFKMKLNIYGFAD